MLEPKGLHQTDMHKDALNDGEASPTVKYLAKEIGFKTKNLSPVRIVPAPQRAGSVLVESHHA